jgi:hypothetical protein
MQEESMLVPFQKSKMLVFIFFLEMKMGRSPLVDNVLEMPAVFLVDVRRDLCEDRDRISCFTHILSHKKTYYYAWVESVVDGTSSGLVNSLAGDFRLLSVIEPHKFK